MPTQETLREVISNFQDASLYVRGAKEYDKLIDQATAEIKSLLKEKLPSSIEIKDLIRKHQIDIGQHRYTDMDRKEIRECCNVDQNDVALAFLTEIEKRLEAL